MSPETIIEKALGLNIILSLKDGTLSYRMPAGTTMPSDLRQEIVDNKAAIMSCLGFMDASGAVRPALPPIVSRERGGDTPLSYGQQQLAFVDRLGGGSRQFNIQGVFRCEGLIDIGSLQQAVHLIVDRHEVLRTNLVELDGQYFQFVSTDFEVPCQVVDLTALPAAERDEALAACIRTDAEAPFDLEQGVMLRVQVVKLSARDSVLVFCMHHIASDGWSIGTFIRELKHFYAAGDAADLPPLPVQYADYALWQRSLLDGPEREKALAFWRDYLRDIPAVHALPLDGNRPVEHDVTAIRIDRPIGAELSARLKALCVHHGVTSFMLLQTAFSVLLNRFSGSDDIVIGTPMSGRIDAALEPLIGLFINTVVIRNRFGTPATFTEHLARAKETNLAIHENQYLPFELLVDELRPARNAAYNPIFQIWFVLQNNEQVSVELPGCVICPDDGGRVDTAKYELNVYITENKTGLSIAWVARASVFAGVTLDCLATAFEQLLRAIVADPGRPVDEYPLFDGRCALAALDRIEEHSAETETLLSRFRRQVETTPGAVAVRSEGRDISYAELDMTSDCVAAALAHHDQSRIGLCLGHDEDFVIAIWACLKAGKTYVPLNHEYPLERLQAIVEDAGIGLVVAHHRTQDLAARLASVGTLDIGPAKAEEQATAPPCDTATPAIAYVLYTSGSTGKPKGVTQLHDNMAYYVDSYAAELSIGPTDRLLQVASFSHDAAVLDMFAALTRGACLHLVDIRRHAPEAVIAAINDGVTIYHSSPSVFKYLFSAATERRAATLRAVVFGGEAPDDAALRIAAEHLDPDTVVANLYGSSEATLVSLHSRRIGDGLDACRYLAGVIPGSSLRIVNERGDAVALYEPGELVVMSDALTPGYLNLPELTRDRFEDESNGLRSYRTGDLGYLRADGSVRFLGRRDNQFKINGQRIEPEEVEAVLLACPSVRAAIAQPMIDDTSGETFVAAFVESTLDDAAWSTELPSVSQRLASVLPVYMRPVSLLRVDALLRTPSGKLDRRGMRAWRVERPVAAASSLPTSRLETEIAGIWSHVLAVEGVGVNDNFFNLGGNSFKSLQIISAIGRRYGLDLSLREFFDGPTVAACASLIATRLDGKTDVEAVHAITADLDNRHRPFPLTGIQQAYWLGRSSAFELGNVATQGYVEHDIQDYDQGRMESALRGLIERHDMLRAVISETGEQSILADVPAYDIEVTDVQAESVEAIESHLIALREEMHSQVRSVHRWPIFDFRVTLLPGGVGRLHVCTDAIIIDARSRSILVRELLELYLDPALILEPIDISFRDYVLAEAALKQGDAWQRARAYWMNRLDTLPRAPDLPLIIDPSQLDKPVFVRRSRRIEKAIWESLRRCAIDLQVTPICLLATAFADVLAYWAARREFTINLTMFNRLPLHEHVERLVGDFTSSSLLQVEVSPGSTFGERVAQTQQQLLSDMDHSLFTGVDMLRELKVRRQITGAALMPVVFTGLVGFRNSEERESAAQQLMNNDSTTVGATQTSQVYLDCQVFDDADTIAVTWNCVDALFFPGVLDDMFDTYIGWLGVLAEDPDARCRATLDLLPAHHRAILEAANATVTPREPGLLHELFTANVAAFATVPAIIAPERSLTYADLDRESDVFATRLSALGVTANEHVGVLMNKGWEQVVAVIAILKAGGAYLPIDANLPTQRIDYLLTQTDARVVLTQPWIDTSALSSSATIEHVVPHRDLETAPAYAQARQSPSDLAYTIFTSGSTGTPKGVMIDHAGAVNTIEDINRRYGVVPADRIFGISDLNFDLSVWDIFGALAAGAALVLPGSHQTRDPQAWHALIEAHGVTLWNSVPALAKLLFEALPAGATSPLRRVMMSGDWIPLDLPGRIRDALPGCAIQSLGGATEASIWSVGYTIDAIDPDWRSVPYGKPLENQTTKILNAELRPCPLWCRGDLYIGGKGVARGYHGDVARTEASFIVDPDDGERLYRTGDVARWMDDGNIEFLGREDSQVKVNGYRIELGEIESQLTQVDGVREAVVVTFGEKHQRRLVAYVVPVDPAQLAMEACALAEWLGAALRLVLPDYMVPAVYVALAAIPLTVNGKVDRRSLPEPDIGTHTIDQVAPATPYEEEVVKLWRSLLQKDAIGVTDNFFALGGNSIVAVRAITALREQYNLRSEDFQFNDFFSGATARAVAGTIERLVADASTCDAEVDSEEFAESGLV